MQYGQNGAATSSSTSPSASGSDGGIGTLPSRGGADQEDAAHYRGIGLLTDDASAGVHPLTSPTKEDIVKTVADIQKVVVDLKKAGEASNAEIRRLQAKVRGLERRERLHVTRFNSIARALKEQFQLAGDFVYELIFGPDEVAEDMDCSDGI